MGLKAKAEAFQVCAEGKGSILSGWRQHLATSISADALRIIGTEADARAEQDRQADGELLTLGRAWEASCARYERACAADDRLDDAVALIAPPEALFNRPEETGKLAAYPKKHVPSGRYWYGERRTIDILRRLAQGGVSDERRVEILRAHDLWLADVVAENELSGFTAAQAERNAAVDENAALRARICLMPARTTSGTDLKLRVILWLHNGLETFARDLEVENVDHPEFSEALALPVSVGPGATAFTRTPEAATSSATDFVMPSTACLLPAYIDA